MKLWRRALAFVAALSSLSTVFGADAQTLRVGSKRFTESYILAHVLSQTAAGHARTEVLQGLTSDREARRVERELRSFPILRLGGLDDFALAASLYRRARRAGLTLRNAIDCLIAAPCIRTGAAILHADADFDRLASCTELRVYPAT